MEEENKWERKDYRIARATHTHTHTQLPPGAEGRPPQTLKHTHPAGFLFQSYLLVDAGRTS